MIGSEGPRKDRYLAPRQKVLELAYNTAGSANYVGPEHILGIIREGESLALSPSTNAKLLLMAANEIIADRKISLRARAAARKRIWRRGVLGRGNGTKDVWHARQGWGQWLHANKS